MRALQHRIIRHLYPGADGYAKLVDAAFGAWERLWERLGRRHLAETGVLALSTQSGDWSDRGRHGLERLGIAHQVWETWEVRRKLPQFAVADGTVGIYTATRPELTGLHGDGGVNLGGPGAPPSVEAVIRALGVGSP